MTTTEISADVFARAAVLVENAWIQIGPDGYMDNNSYCYCLVTSIANVTDFSEDTDNYLKFVQKVLPDSDSKKTAYSNLTAWNDTPDRTKQDVFDLYDAVIEEFHNAD